MKKKNRYKNKDIYRVKSHIYKIFPHANKVDVRVNKLPNGEFKSFIRVLAPQKKELVALKRDKNIKKCLEKSHLAIIRQIHRIKTKWDKTNVGLSNLAASA